ncbi:virulence factor [Kiloniella sp. b19]|uniref:virulence factor n=1 Tax=Kiloniella sp. GXU_MW_B19 TaxID=3141326 RepID=UPI0031DF9DD1
MAKLTITYWRDIPAQVTVKAGRKNAKRILDERFEKAIDRAAMKAKLRDTDSYLAEWRKGEPQECGDDLEAVADEAAASIEKEYTNERLDELVANGGLV